MFTKNHNFNIQICFVVVVCFAAVVRLAVEGHGQFSFYYNFEALLFKDSQKYSLHSTSENKKGYRLIVLVTYYFHIFNYD